MYFWGDLIIFGGLLIFCVLDLLSNSKIADSNIRRLKSFGECNYERNNNLNALPRPIEQWFAQTCRQRKLLKKNI